MSESHDPVKDAVRNLFGWGKKEEEKHEPTPAEQVAQQAAALGEQAAAQHTTPANPFADPTLPTEQSPTYSNPFSDNPTPVENTPASAQDYSNSASAVEAAPAPAQEHPAIESQAVAQAEPAPAPPASNPDVESINGHAVGYAFLRYYKEHPEIGQPVDEQHGNVGGYQMFENAILHWDGSNVQVEKRGAQAQGGGQRTYTVNSGDNLSAIAQQMYGDASQWRRIFEANRDKISNPDLIHPGQELVIP